MRACSLVLLLTLGACGDPKALPALPLPQDPPAAPKALLHDFGVIRHGQAAEHQFVLDTRSFGDYVAVGVRADCSCAHSTMALRAADGTVRSITGQPLSEFAARDGEQLVITVQIDTVQKEPVDLAPVQSHATVELQPVQGPDAALRRIRWPLVFRFGIDAPVKLQPFAVLDFERVPTGTDKQVLTTLRSDLPDRAIAFGPAICDDPRVRLLLEPEGERTVLRATWTPAAGDLGPFRALVRVATDLPDGYVVQLAAVGKVVPDLEATPFAKISLRGDLGPPQPESALASQSVLVTDHDRRRAPEFVIAEFVDEQGRDAHDRFEVRLAPIAGDPRSHRVGIRALGGASGNFRGRLVLAKDRQAGPFLPIEIVAFHVPRP